MKVCDWENFEKGRTVFIGYRKITPKESFNLMGWDDQVNKILDLPKTTLYHVTGNSMVIPVMEAIFKELLKGEK
jgi:site-specific DNA-cytosine methylase